MTDDYQPPSFDKFPLIMKSPLELFRNESDFCDFLVDEPGIWIHLGVEAPSGWRSNMTPDILTRVRGSKTKKSRNGLFFGIEVEMEPRNLVLHGHDTFNIHLLLTLSAPWYRRKIQSVPIVSLYRVGDDGWARRSWSDDIGVLYHRHHSMLFDNRDTFGPGPHQQVEEEAS